MVNLLTEIAKGYDATPAQIALAWLLARKPWIVPIPRTTKLHRLLENMGATKIQLNTDTLSQITHAATKIEIHGARYPESAAKMIDR